MLELQRQKAQLEEERKVLSCIFYPVFPDATVFAETGVAAVTTADAATGTAEISAAAAATTTSSQTASQKNRSFFHLFPHTFLQFFITFCLANF